MSKIDRVFIGASLVLLPLIVIFGGLFAGPHTPAAAVARFIFC